ncbi:MAG: trehalose-6-phosphate synthase [Chloroflexi bacterium]|nr:trehalose-6-phosphate synthase [Chloroflexota bacterium]
MSAAIQDESRRARLLEMCFNTLEGNRLILVSNRGPVEHSFTPNGHVQARRGSGGLVTAFSPIMRDVDFTWVASAMGEGDRRVAEDAGGGSIRPNVSGYRFSVRYVTTPRRVYHKYYNTFCNPLLWFLQHYMWNSSYTPSVDDVVYDAWDNGYVPVNRSFADAVLAETAGSAGPPCVLIHDYHMYLVAGYVRESLPDAIIQHFVHIPWPASAYWELVPAHIRRAICESLCSANIVGFQTQRDGSNFLQACQEFLPGACVDYVGRSVTFKERQTFVRAYPLSISVEEVQRIAASPRVQGYERQLRNVCAEKTIVRVDRAEPNKNILRGFRAYEILLYRHPELRGRVKFLAFLVPSRTHIRQFQRYLEEIEQQVKAINDSCGTPDWQPVHLFMENNYPQAVAGLRLYDILMANVVIDGMNLVAKEGPIVNAKDGVVVLSESAGAYPQLAAGVLPVSAADVEGTMQAMYTALTMSSEERQRRSALLKEAIEREDILDWFQRQLEDIRALAGKQVHL